MGKAEIFATATGIIGLVADVITILDKIHNHPSQTEARTSSGITLFIFTMTYGWFILSWFLVRWKCTRHKLRSGGRRKVTSDMFSGSAVFLLGVLLFPLSAYMGSAIGAQNSHDDFYNASLTGIGAAAVAMFVVGALIWFAIMLGMPLIYDDIRSS
jgi:hypothetical protein